MPYLIVPIILMSVLSTIVTTGLGGFFVRHLRLSPLEMPSMICTWIWMLGASGQFAYFPLAGTLIQPEMVE
jgi:urea transporter